jgi:hypothetical protein
MVLQLFIRIGSDSMAIATFVYFCFSTYVKQANSHRKYTDFKWQIWISHEQTGSEPIDGSSDDIGIEIVAEMSLEFA